MRLREQKKSRQRKNRISDRLISIAVRWQCWHGAKSQVGAMEAECGESRVTRGIRQSRASGTSRHCRASTWSASAWAFHATLARRGACSVCTLCRGRSPCSDYAADRSRTYPRLLEKTQCAKMSSVSSIAFFLSYSFFFFFSFYCIFFYFSEDFFCWRIFCVCLCDHAAEPLVETPPQPSSTQHQPIQPYRQASYELLFYIIEEISSPIPTIFSIARC